jgi:hypothetical protein
MFVFDLLSGVKGVFIITLLFLSTKVPKNFVQNIYIEKLFNEALQFGDFQFRI